MGSGSWNFTTTSGDTPAHLDAWCKAALDITTPVDIDTATNDVSLLEASANASIARVWIDPYKSPRGEYFLLENRQLSGYDAGLPGSGLLIFHVDDSMSTNGDETHKWVDVEEADGLAHLDSNTNRGDDGDPFPGTSSNVLFNGSSNPNSDDYDSLDTGIVVSGIPASAATMAVDITARTGGVGDNVTYAANVTSAWGYSNVTAWTAVRFTNSTAEDRIEGFDVYLLDTCTVDFYLYESIPGNDPTTLLHTQTGFAGTAGWNRFLLTTPQSFPVSSDRVMVLRIVDSSYLFPVASESSGSNSGRSFLDFDGAGAFDPGVGRDFCQILLLRSAVTPVAELSSASYAVNEGDGVVTITVNLDVAPATTCSVQYATSNGTASEPDDYTNTSGTLTFTSSDTFLTFDVPIVDDGTSESPETFTVTLSTPTNCTLSGTNNPATVTITSNDTPQATVYADFAWTGGESGSFANPYNTFSEAVAGVSSGGTINIDGTSGDTISGYTGTLNTAVTLMADPVGTVQIGSTGGGSK